MRDSWKEIMANCKLQTRAQHRIFNKLKRDNTDLLCVERTSTPYRRQPEEAEKLAQLKVKEANCVAEWSKIVLLRIEDEGMRRNPPSGSPVLFDC